MIEESARADLVDRIWKLKCALRDDEGTYVHFKMCLEDEGYRQEVIQRALGAASVAIREQAAVILGLDEGGSLLRRPSRQQVPEAPATPPRAAMTSQQGAVSMAPAAAPLRRAESPRGRGGGFFVVVFLLAGLAAGAWYLDLHRRLPFEIPGLGVSSQVVSGSILESTVWRADSPVVLDGLVFVESGARLTIEPGSVVRGRPGSALIVTRDATILARGSAERPIVFTSDQPVGQRRTGDWGGVVLLGNAPLNRGQGQIEGIDDTDSRGSFGGADTASNCGVLEYARIEFAGFEIGANNELNGLTLGGCGDATIVRYVQSHLGKDDGVEVFGGTVDLKNVVITGASDDSLDWDMGWTGRVQHLVIQQYADRGDNAFEGDNDGDRPDAEPRSRPQFSNVSLVGSRNPEAAQRAMTIRHGSGGQFRNVIIAGFPGEAVDLRGDGVAALVASGTLSFSHVILHDIGAGGVGYFADESGEADDDAGFDELGYFARTAEGRLVGADPLLDERAFDPRDPWMVPAMASPAVNGVAVDSGDEFWDESAGYLGAFRPGDRVSWMDRWTAFPAN